MKQQIFFKPELKLPKSPIINMWIEADYKNIKTSKDLNDFILKSRNEIACTQNKIKKAAYVKVVEWLNAKYKDSHRK